MKKNEKFAIYMIANLALGQQYNLAYTLCEQSKQESPYYKANRLRFHSLAAEAIYEKYK